MMCVLVCRVQNLNLPFDSLATHAAAQKRGDAAARRRLLFIAFGFAVARDFRLRVPAHDGRAAVDGGRGFLSVRSGRRRGGLRNTRRRGKPGGDERNRNFTIRGSVAILHDGSEDNQRGRVDEIIDDLSGFVDFVQSQIAAAGDVSNNAGGAVDAQIEQRGRNRGFGSFARAVLAARTTDTHERRASVRHHGAHIREIDVDQARQSNNIGDAADALAKNIVGEQKRILHRQRRVHGGEQAIVRNNDERIHVLSQTFDGFHRLVVSLTSFKLERHRHDADG